MRPTDQRTRLAGDLGLYAISAGFALFTAAASTLPAHRAWGAVAWPGYAAAAVLTLTLFAYRREATPVRAAVTVATWLGTAIVPLVVQAVQRAGGRTGRAQEEVTVIESSASRLLATGSPYLDRAELAAVADKLLAYDPYQPGMSVFGLPRALAGDGWYTDARLWFALATGAALVAAISLLLRPNPSGTEPLRSEPPHPNPPGPNPLWFGARGPAVVRGVQFATVVPVCALTLATGGDDLPVLALCLLALAGAAIGRFGLAGLAVGAAAACKLFAWPIAIVLAVHAVTRGRRPTIRYLAGAVGLPLLTTVPVLLTDPGGMIENVVRFPLGHGLVTSPARSPLPGYLIAQHLPGGRAIALGLLAAAGLAIAVHLIRRPPRTAVAAAVLCGYGLAAAMLLLPSTRFGYLLYPLALLVWAPALRTPADDRA